MCGCVIHLAGFPIVGFNDIWGNAPNDVYGVGSIDSSDGKSYWGAIIHYDGRQWQYLKIPNIRTGFSAIRRDSESGFYFLSATTSDTRGDTEEVYTSDGVNVREIYRRDAAVGTVNEVAGLVYIAISGKIYRYENNQWSLWKDLTGTTFLGALVGRSEKDFLSLASDGIGHYNGTDFKTIFKTDADVSGIQVFEQNVFMLASILTQATPIVIHGVLI